MTNVRACPSGIAVAGRPGLRFRDAFLGTVAAGALSLAFGGPALAACTTSGGGTIETCTGDQSNGIAITSPTTVTTLNVNNLSTAITPPTGIDGIQFTSAGTVTINSNTGTFGITTQGANAGGILASSSGSGAVTVISTGNITTASDSAFGIEASGNAGAQTVTSIGNITTTGNGAFGIGAVNGGAGAVTVTSTGNITTAGSSAYGLGAVAFGGSAATVTSTGNITTAGASSNGIYAGSFAGAVTVTSTGNIATAGAGSIGIYARGNGAGAVTVTSTGNITIAGAYAAGIKATGFGAVTVTSTGNIATTGASANGIYAVSNGGGAVTVISIGNITTGNASGILANTSGSGAATVTSTGNITTASDSAFGIEASSNAGAATVTSTGNIATAGNGAFGIGALNGGAGAVTVTSTGNITTAGDVAFGVLASTSGTGPIAVTSTGNITTAGANAAGILADGGGAVTVTSTGNIGTAGNSAYGIFARSISGPIAVTSTGNITTTGSNARGIFARGNGTDAVTVTSTGNITTAGDTANGIYARGSGSGAMTVTSTGNIRTAGSNAYGIVAVNDGAGAVTVISTGNITTAGVSANGILAADDGSGAVTVTSTGNITTAGNGAPGIGAEGFFNGVTVNSTGNIVTGGANANGVTAIAAGAVAVTSTGNIAAAGNSSNGIYASGFGSGGVAVTSTGNITIGGDSSNGIIALNSGYGAIVVTSTGNITTKGRYADGIFAAATRGAIVVTSTGNITTAGSGSFGISAEGSGPIAVTIKSGTVSGGSGTGAGVALLGGTNNTLTNMGTVTALSGLAIVGDTGNNSINNFGTVIGNVNLGAGTNAFNNMAGGFFNSGSTVNLGARDTLTNAGTLSPGGAGVIQTTALTGNLVQSATGRLFTDINIGGATSDRLNVSGTANLAGAVQVQVLNPQLGPWQQTVLSATGGTTNSGLALLASPALQAQLVYPNATDVVVKSTGINFLTPGLNNNQSSLANAFNGAAQTSGLGGPVFNFLLNGVSSVPGYNLALTQLSGEAATGTQQTTFDAMNTFMGTMLDPFNRGTTSMPGGSVSGYASEGDASAYASDGRKRTAAERDAYAMFTKAPPQTFEARWNVWAAGFGGSQTTDGNAAVGSNGATSRIAGTAVGADYLFSPNTIAGFALAGGGTSFNVGNGLGSGRSDLFQAGVYARHTMGAAYIAGALAYGWQDITTDRTVTLAGLDQLQARFNANAFSGRVEGGYRFVSPWMGVAITPYAAAQFTTFDLPAYAEQALIGTNNFALAYGAKSVTDPRSEFGFRTDKSFAMPDGVLTLRGRLAWAHDYDTDRSIGATFQTLPGASFVVNGAAQASDSVLTTASIERKWTNNWSIAATFEGEFSNVTSSYAGKGVVRYQW
jgi:uncharacterized protein with beta-barrel porin domain